MNHASRGLGVVLALLTILSGCASTEFAAVNKEPGYYYGYGSGASETAAQEAAFLDLVYSTFTESGAIKAERKAKVVLTEEMKAAVRPLATKPFLAEKKSETSFTAVYRIKYTDWSASETIRQEALLQNLGGRFQWIQSDTKSTLGGNLVEAVKLMKELDRHGVTLAPKTAALGDAIVRWATGKTAGMTFQFEPATGLVTTEQSVKVVLTAAGQPLSGIPVTLSWVADLGDTVPLNVVTDAQGVALAPYPAGDKFRNVKSVLKASTRIGSLVAETTFLGSLDAAGKGEASYRNSVVLANLKTPEVLVPGGTYTIGAVKHDRRAGGKEKARSATVGSFYIDVKPVTNAQFRSYLEATALPKAQWPDFLQSEDLAGPEQPVVGVTLAEAQAYAEWASGVLGVKKRLPTEAEYEVAARAGQDVIYPWGDQPPTEGVRANYTGNKLFTSTSPVGSFPSGANLWGLLDMVGNVWQWTTSAPDAQITAEPSFRIIKGGSWLDGPGELRISNRRAVDPAESASDLGFRLVREAN